MRAVAKHDLLSVHRQAPARTSRWLRLVTAIVLAVALAAGVAAPSAGADGDPGSDVLVFQDLFTGSAGLSAQQQLRFGGLLKAAARAGRPVRVAIIASLPISVR